MNKVLEYIIAAKDNTANAIKSALNRVKEFAGKVGNQLANIKAGFDMLGNVARSFANVFGTAIKEAFSFEKAVTDFKVLLGSVDEAKKHIADLRQFASSTPLTFGDLSQASKLLLSFGASVDEVMPAMKMLGDISMGNAQKFQGLALVFAQVKSAGKLMGQDLLQMINQGFNPLTIIAQETGKSVGELKDMVSEGAISFDMVAEAMRVATSEGGLFNNAMKEASQTGEGLMSTLSDKWTDAVRTFGEAFTDSAKGGLQLLIDKITELVEDGTVEVWAHKIADGLASVVEVAKDAAGAIGKVVDAYNTVRDWLEEKGAAVGGYIGALAGGGSFGDASEMAREQARMVRREQEDRKAEQIDLEREIRRNARERAAKKDAAKESETKAAKTLTEMMTDAEAASKEKALKAAEEAARKAADAEERERKRIEDLIAKERERQQRALIDQYRKGVTEANEIASKAQARLEAASAKAQQAWGWYRDRDSWKAQLDEERANAAAEVQFVKDAERVTSKWHWRTAKLNDEDELIRRVVLAREEETAAREYAKETAIAAKQAAAYLETMAQVMTECE